MYFLISILTVWFSLFAFWAQVGWSRVELGGAEYDIPNKNILGASLWELPLLLGYDDPFPEKKTILLVIDEKEIAKRVGGYRADETRLGGRNLLIEELNEEDLEIRGNPETPFYRKIWNKTMLSGEPMKVEFDNDTGLYLGYGESKTRETAVFLQVMRIPPGSLERIPDNPFDFWVGSCVRASCQTSFLSGGLEFRPRIDLENLHLADEIHAAILDILSEWRVKDGA